MAREWLAGEVSGAPTTDALTNLSNRPMLYERLVLALKRAKRTERIALHVIDLDHFKAVNDDFGHPVGDELLRLVAVRLRTVAQKADTIARIGADEFALAQITTVDRGEATRLAQQVIEALSGPYEIDGHRLMVGASIGIAIGPGDGQNAEQLVRHAALALALAKKEGGGIFRFFDPHKMTDTRDQYSEPIDFKSAARRRFARSLGEEVETAIKVLKLLKREWFGGQFGRDATYVVPLLLSAFVAAKAGKPLSKKASLEAMGAEDAKTARKYVALVKSIGLVEVGRAANDKRQELLWPTRALETLMNRELEDVWLEWSSVDAAEGTEIDELATGAPGLPTQAGSRGK